MSLLEDAKKLPNQNYKIIQIGKEEKELVLAYLAGEINSNQLRKVMKKDGVQIYSFIVRAVKELIKDGKISLS